MNPGLRHKAGDPAYSWSAVKLLAPETLNAVSGHELRQYVQNLEPGYPMSNDDAAAKLVTGDVQSCFATGQGTFDGTPVGEAEGLTVLLQRDGIDHGEVVVERRDSEGDGIPHGAVID